jgi:hypothetical protein
MAELGEWTTQACPSVHGRKVQTWRGASGLRGASAREEIYGAGITALASAE